MILLFIDNLSWKTNEQEVERLFSRYGRIRSIKLTLRAPHSARSSFGFIEMEGNGAQKVISALDGHLLWGMYLRITEVLSRGKSQKNPGTAIALNQPTAVTTTNYIRQTYRLESVEKVIKPESEPERDWYRYTLISGNSRVTGLHCGTMAEVTKYAADSAEAFNLRNSKDSDRSYLRASSRYKK